MELLDVNIIYVLISYVVQAKADEIAKLMNENEHLKSIINKKVRSFL